MLTGVLGTLLLAAIIVFLIPSAIFCAWLAGEKLRSGPGWFILGLLFGIPALLALVGAPARKEEEIHKLRDERQLRREAAVMSRRAEIDRRAEELDRQRRARDRDRQER